MPYTVEDYKRDLLEEVVKAIPAEEILSRFDPEERLRGLPPEVLSQFRLEERPVGLSVGQVQGICEMCVVRSMTGASFGVSRPEASGFLSSYWVRKEFGDRPSLHQEAEASGTERA